MVNKKEVHINSVVEVPSSADQTYSYQRANFGVQPAVGKQINFIASNQIPDDHMLSILVGMTESRCMKCWLTFTNVATTICVGLATLFTIGLYAYLLV